MRLVKQQNKLDTLKINFYVNVNKTFILSYVLLSLKTRLNLENALNSLVISLSKIKNFESQKIETKT